MNGLINGVVFLDLKKAFDTVDQEILIKKLEFCGIKNNALRWFISYLSNRKRDKFDPCMLAIIGSVN